MSNKIIILDTHNKTNNRRRGKRPLLSTAARRSPRQIVWEAIRARKTFCNTEIARDTGLKMNAVRRCVVLFRQAGFIAVAQSGGQHSEALYTLVNDVGVDAPRVTVGGRTTRYGAVQDAIWKIIRIVREFDAREIAALVPSASFSAVRGYISALHLTQYLICTHRATTGGDTRVGGLSRYRLNPARNSGPRHPIPRDGGVVYDPNTGEEHERE